MACVWAFKKGAKRVIGIDNNWRTEFAKKKIPGLETINYEELKKQSIPAKIHEMVPGGVDACIEASGGEYAKTWTHKLELMSGMEQDTSEMINECIYSTRKFGRVGIIGDYVGCKLSNHSWLWTWTHSATVTNHFNIGAVMERGIRLIGCGQCPVQKCKDLVPKWVGLFTDMQQIGRKFSKCWKRTRSIRHSW